MLPDKQSRLLNTISLSLFLALLFSAVPAFAAEAADAVTTTSNTTLSAADMLVNFAKNIPDLSRLVTATAYVMGMWFVIAGVIKLKHAGEMRTQMSHEHSMKGPIIYLSVGAALMYLPNAVQVGMSTFWTEPNPYGYLQEKDQWADFFNTCYLVVQLFGVIAFIRGLVILSHIGGHGHGGQQGTFGRGMTHIIGGILCINIYQFVQVIMITLGIQSVLG